MRERGLGCFLCPAASCLGSELRLALRFGSKRRVTTRLNGFARRLCAQRIGLPLRLRKCSLCGSFGLSQFVFGGGLGSPLPFSGKCRAAPYFACFLLGLLTQRVAVFLRLLEHRDGSLDATAGLFGNGLRLAPRSLGFGFRLQTQRDCFLLRQSSGFLGRFVRLLQFDFRFKFRLLQRGLGIRQRLTPRRFRRLYLALCRRSRLLGLLSLRFGSGFSLAFLFDRFLRLPARCLNGALGVAPHFYRLLRGKARRSGFAFCLTAQFGGIVFGTLA